MDLEDSVRYHEQWLRAIDSNLGRVTDRLAEVEETHKRTEDALAVVAQNQATFVAGLTSLTAEVRALTAQVSTNAEQLQRLEKALEQWLRFRGNGGGKRN